MPPCLQFGSLVLLWSMVSISTALSQGSPDTVADTRFDVDRGFFDAPFDLTISCATPGATIVYTTDGNTPTLSNGTAVPPADENTPPTAVLTISNTTVVRAAAFKSGLTPTNVDTHSYLFPEGIIDQSDTPLPGYPLPWITRSGSAIGGDYGMDSDIVGPVYSREEVKGALRSLPTISIVTDIANLFDQQIGIQVNPRDSGLESERPVSVEMIGFEDGRNVQGDAGMRMNGNASRSPTRPKHNFRIIYRDTYGDGRLKYPLFGGEAPVDRFNQFVLRGGNGDSWIHPSSFVYRNAMYIRDQWFRDAHTAMGYPEALQREVHVYFNGLYWGMHHLFERIEEEWAAERFGGNDEDWEGFRIVAGNNIEVIQGTPAEEAANFLDSWRAVVDAAAVQDLAAVEQYLDLDAFIDYLLLNFHAGNNDWDSNNVRAMRRTNPAGKFMWFCHDAERAGFNVNGSVTVNNLNVTNKNTTNGPTGVNTALRGHPEYAMRFADRAYRHLFNGGALTAENGAAQWAARADGIREALKAESARWGDFRGDPPRTLVQWEAALQREYDDWFPHRTAVTISQLRANGLYPSIDPPVLNQHGGEVPEGFEVTITAAEGTIYYTTDGTDPRLPGGAISSLATAYGTGIVISDRLTRVLARTLVSSTGEWSALADAEFEIPIAPILISEVLAHTDLPEVDSIELHNPGPASVDIGGWFLTDDFSAPQKFRIPDGTTISAGGYLVFDEGDFFGGPNGFRLSEHGEQAYLFSGDSGGELTGYSHGWDFKASPNGVTTGRYTDSQGKVHFVLQRFNTLGEENSRPLVGPVVISQIHYHPPELEQGVNNAIDEFIELTNTSAAGVALYNTDTSVPGYGDAALADTWRLRNAVDFDFPTGVEMGPGERILVVGFDPSTDSAQLASFRSKFSIPDSTKIFGPWSGQLSNSGEEIELKYPGTADPLLSFFVPYYTMEEVDYEDDSPWPRLVDGFGFSLHRIGYYDFGNDPQNWEVGAPLRRNNGVDTDEDGMEDSWEVANGLFVGIDDSALDPDRDGKTNLEEFKAKTLPNDPSSYLHLRVEPSELGLRLQFTAAADVAYKIQYADSIVPPITWRELQHIGSEPEERELEIEVRATLPKRFFQVIVAPFN